MVETENKVIQCRRDTAANWASNNPVPKAGEWCFETDTGITKIGDGSTAYNSLVPFRQTTATTIELNKLHSLSTTNTELGYVHGVTSAIQTQINSKFAKANIQTSFEETLSDEKVASEKLVKNSLDVKQDGITVANSSMLKASVLSAMNIVGENNSGRRYDEPKTLAKMISAAHSTFDNTKFTAIHGTPIITSDGLMYGTVVDNVASGIVLDKTLIIPGHNYRLKLKYTYVKANSDGVTQWMFFLRFDNVASNFGFTIREDNAITVNVDGVASMVPLSTFSMVENQSYIFELASDFKTYFKIYANGNLIYSNESLTLTYETCSSFIIGNNLSYQVTRYNVGPIDLKYLEIKDNGIPVFSGNNTGIDIIKSNDYIVMGSPTISTDGVASGFTAQTDYITATFNSITPIKSLEICTRVRVAAVSDNQGTILALYNNLRVEQNGTSIYVKGDIVGTTVSKAVTGLAVGDIIDIYTKIEPTGVYLKLTKGTTDYETTSTQSITFAAEAGVHIGVFYTNNNYPFSGSIDLNATKIVVDGDLVYQPCLKIPYTLAANDKKFINPIYEDRAKDMAEQFNCSPYLILQENDTPNYAIVGTPTISNDYIASDFSLNNYIIIGNKATLSKLTYFAIHTVFITPSEWGNQGGRFWSHGTQNYVGHTTTGKISGQFLGTAISNSNLSELGLSTEYEAYFIYDASGWYVKYREAGDTSWVTSTPVAITSDTTITLTTQTIGKENVSGAAYAFLGSIDLKQFYIAINNMSIYHTIITPNFILPYGSIDEKVAPTMVVAEYDYNGTSWVQYLDRTMIQRGTMVADTDVTFPCSDEFADTNYTLSCPFSAKTTSGFTPSASGTYIAVGKF